ncbi:MAG TPA: plasmid pRiA4b ORF-3 family protein [Xanthobacteraceae bacterium]|nr:plasmid pRiA4b ORF-3 family protein [Xanthobacteraceae bacterium]
MSSTTIAVLKITLDQVKPPVLRRVEVPFDIRLDRLHLVIQAAMGWTNSHLYEIRAGDVGWSTPYDDDPLPNDVLDARKARLGRVIKHAETKKLTYLYDFGDGWKHSVRIERLADPLPGVAYPRLTEAVGRCPPEDVGGPWGYAEFLEAIADPKHARHAELTEWIAEDFDPNDVPTKWLADEVAELAESWSRPPRVRQARSA